MLKPIQISASAPIMPSMRVSTSVALSSRRMAGSLGAALVALGAAEVMAPSRSSLYARAATGAASQQESRAALEERRGLLFFHSVKSGQLSRRT